MEQRYDAVVIGSGIGGLAAAAALAKVGGKRVLVLERHFKAGGFTHTFHRKAYSWDVGLHYVGEMEPTSEARQVMDFVTGGQVQWKKMPDRFDHCSYPGFEFEVPSDPVQYEAELSRAFPKEAKAIKAYFLDISRTRAWCERYFAARMMPRPLAWLMTRPGASAALATTGDYLKARFADERLRAVVASQWGAYGLPPGKSAFALHALIVHHYFHGGWYPEGGSAELAKGAQRVIEAAGGTVQVNHEVTRILVEGRRATGVEVRRGIGGRQTVVTFSADVVLSTAGAALTYGALLPPLGLEEQRPRPREEGRSVVVAYLGLKQSPATLGFLGENRRIFRDWNHDELAASNTAEVLEGRPRYGTLSLQSMKDPRAKAYAAQILTSIEPEAFAAWRGSVWRHRPAEYQALKQKVLDGLLGLVEARYPGFRALVDYAELATPLSVETFTGHPRGAIYGAAGTPARFGDWRHRVRTPLKGLFLAGADAAAVGIVGAMMGGVMAAGATLGGRGFFHIMDAARAVSPSTGGPRR